MNESASILLFFKSSCGHSGWKYIRSDIAPNKNLSIYVYVVTCRNADIPSF